jgi:alpha-tubulin suppressor-like RCC1 family protein
VTVRIDQAGGSGFDPAPPIYRTFSVGVGFFSKLAAGSLANHAVGIKSDSTLWTWGRNNAGQLGLADSVERNVPTQVGSLTWNTAAVGAEFTVAIRSNGTLWAWGKNADGQLGLGDTVDRSAPVQVGVATTWAQVAAGANFVIAVQTNGTLWAWGGNASSQLGLGDTTSRNVPTQVGVATNWYTNASAYTLAAGTAHAIARNSSGQLFTWGLNTSGQLGHGDTSSRTTPTQVGTLTLWSNMTCGPNSSFALQGTTGSLWAWGNNNSSVLGDGTTTSRSSPVQIGTATTWNFITAGGGHTLARRSDGSLWAWGGNSAFAAQALGDSGVRSAPLRVGTENTWAAVAAGNLHTAATQTNGTLWTAGSGQFGQLAHPASLLTPIANNVIAMGANTYSSHYIRSDGTLWGVGSNFGDVGDGTNTRRTQPVQIGVDTNWQVLAAGVTHTLALRSNGTLWANGINASSQLGDGTTTTRNSFVQIGVAADWAKIATGQLHSAGIKSNGTLWAWGSAWGWYDSIKNSTHPNRVSYKLVCGRLWR